MTDQPTAETGAEATPSIEDTLNATFDSIQARDDADEGTEGTDTSETAAETGAEAADTDTASEEGAETTDQDGAEGVGTAEQPLSPDERWSADDKAKFASLPREAQEFALKREADVQRYLTQESQKIADIKRTYEPLERHIGPRREAWALSGFTPDTALEHLFALSDFATRDKPGFIRWFAQQNGVDIGELSAGAENAPDPKLTALEQRIASFEQTEQQRQQQAVTAQRQAVASAIETFAADTKSHPYFKEVENEVALLLPGVKAQNPGASSSELLKIAYDKACRANDSVNTKLMADKERLKNLEAANLAKKAKLAGGSNVKTSGSTGGGTVHKTIDDTMDAVYDRMTARA